MSISDLVPETDFDSWIALTQAERGPFTAHAVLLRDAEAGLTPLCGTWLDFASEAEWGEMVIVFAGSGLAWDAVAFFPAAGLLDNPIARSRMQQLEADLDAEPRLLGTADIFWANGHRVSPDLLG